MGDTASVEQQVAKIRSFSELPVCVGFGVKTAEQAANIAAFSDGVVVGSHFVSQIPKHCGDGKSMLIALEETASAMRKAVERGIT